MDGAVAEIGEYDPVLAPTGQPALDQGKGDHSVGEYE